MGGLAPQCRQALVSGTRKSASPLIHHHHQAIFTSIIRPQSARQAHSHSSPKQARVFSPATLFIGLIIGGTTYFFLSDSNTDKTLNDTTFVPYTITSREAISPTSFIITIKPENAINPAVIPYIESISSSWKWPLWSVEFKQPEVQISRHYTPLPPQGSEDPADGTLRFYIRAVGDGEMSNYLCRRAVGQQVWLRGPHVGFELRERLGRGGEKGHVVFLAGGTGVVPGMQAAKAVLEGSSETKVDLLWAVRKREEVQSVAAPSRREEGGGESLWKFWQRQTRKKPTEIDAETQEPSPIASRIKALKLAYGDRLKIQVVVDEEGTCFGERDLEACVVDSPSKGAAHSVALTQSCSRSCVFHDQRAHERVSEFEPRGVASCSCRKDEAGGSPGKNLFVVSGPDGFISHYAGQKVWLGGQQCQGLIGGVMSRLYQKYPRLDDQWLVLKL